MTSLEQTSTPGSFVHFTIHFFMQKQEEGKKNQNKIVFWSENFEFVYVGKSFRARRGAN